MKKISRFTRMLMLSGLVLLANACATTPRPQAKAVRIDNPYHEVGIASWYGPGFHGRKTANGERYDQNEMTCAHKTLPFGTHIKVTNTDTQEFVIVRVNDRGPFYKSRVVDLSKAAAKKLNIVHEGTAHVVLEILPTYAFVNE